MVYFCNEKLTISDTITYPNLLPFLRHTTLPILGFHERSCSMPEFGINGDETLVYATRELISQSSTFLYGCETKSPTLTKKTWH